MRAATLAALLLAATAPAFSATDAAEWRFEVFLNDKPIGFHTFSLSRERDEQVLQTEATFDVKFLFVTAFRYRHTNTETWRDGCLTSVEARTNSNGKELDVVGEQRDSGFWVSHDRGREALDECVRSFAYWNPTILGAKRLLNTQTGEYESIEVSPPSEDRVAVGKATVDASRYTLSAKGGAITLWYARDDGRWLALEAPAKGGRRIRYQPIEVPPVQSFAGFAARAD